MRSQSYISWFDNCTEWKLKEKQCELIYYWLVSNMRTRFYSSQFDWEIRFLIAQVTKRLSLFRAVVDRCRVRISHSLGSLDEFQELKKRYDDRKWKIKRRRGMMVKHTKKEIRLQYDLRWLLMKEESTMLLLYFDFRSTLQLQDINVTLVTRLLLTQIN